MNRFDISHAPDIVRVSKARVNVVPAHYEFDRTIFLSDSHRADLGPRAQEHARPPASRGTDGEAKVDKEKRKKKRDHEKNRLPLYSADEWTHCCSAGGAAAGSLWALLEAEFRDPAAARQRDWSRAAENRRRASLSLSGLLSGSRSLPLSLRRSSRGILRARFRCLGGGPRGRARTRANGGKNRAEDSLMKLAWPPRAPRYDR